jgi:UDP-glucose 4-epimerase
MVSAGHEVSVVDNLTNGRIDNVPRGVTFHHADIQDRDALDSIFSQERPELICHLAAQINIRRSILDPVYDAMTNVVGSINVIDSGLKHGMTNFLYSNSGGAIYGDPDPESLPVSENATIAPLSPYGASKYAVETYLGQYSRVFEFSYTSLRLPNVYGPRQDPSGEGGVIAIFIGNMLEGNAITVFGDGSSKRDYTHVSDVADAFLKCASLPGHNVLNIGTSLGTTVVAIADQLGHILGYEKPFQYGPARVGEVAESRLDATRANRTIGWVPTFSVHDGLLHTTNYLSSLKHTYC